MRSRFPAFSSRALQRHLGMPEKAELWTAAFLFVAAIFCKLWNVFRYQFDSDESQHLHVIWAWTHGFVQYRDVFDNHMPLFQLLCAPLLALMGERAAVLYWMRLLMVPLYLLTAWCLYRLGAVAFSRRTGVWAVGLLAGMSVYQFCSTEFRTDNLWALLWFLCLLVLVRNPFTVQSFITGGLLLGLCFAVSMKTLLLLAAIVSAMGVAIALVGWRRLDLSARQVSLGAGVFVLCAAIVPALVMTFFAVKGVWPYFVHDVFAHNIEPTDRTGYLNLILLAAGLPVLLYGTRRFIRHETDPIVAFRHAFLLFVCGAYFLLMRSAWPHATRQNYLPFFPLLSLLCAAGLVQASEKLQARGPGSLRWIVRRFSLPAMVAVLVMFLDLGLRLPTTDETASEMNLVRDVLVLTKPRDYVFDCKGETVFRSRCVPDVFETITLGHMARGEVTHDIARRCIETNTRVAVIGGDIPRSDEDFIEANFLPVGNEVRVAGHFLPPVSAAHAAIPFHISMADDYEVLSATGPAAGLLDGTPLTGPRFLSAGEHAFEPDHPGPPLAVLWARAAGLHFSPFQPSANEHPIRSAEMHPPFLRPVHLFGRRSL
ncbi:MAG: glycosyltransferase family 39 protein [Chthoniobacterales bacterium]